jgi:integrase
MPQKTAGLTARRVQTQTKPGLFGDGGGLYLQVAPTGAKTWIYRYQLAGKRRDMGLGSASAFSLAEARERAREARRLVADGIDPIETRNAKRMATALGNAKRMTFKECAESYIAANKAGWSNLKHAAQWPSSLDTYVYPVFGELPVDTIDTALVTMAIEPTWSTKPETASRVRGRIESVLDWAKVRGYRQGENPARWRGHLENLLPKKAKVRRVEHHAALPYSEIAAFMAELRQKQPSAAALGLEFAILTAARTGDVIGARWSEINSNDRLWTVPGERMKAGREHRVPLSDAALAVVEKMAAVRQGDFMFPGGKAGTPLNHASLLMVIRRRMARNDLTVHGFRSTFRDWAAERTNFPGEVAEMALAHIVSGKVEAAYRRGDLFEKRREIMAAWANFADGQQSLNVVPLRA